MDDGIERLGQVAGIYDQGQGSEKRLKQRATQFLSLFGIDAMPTSDQVDKLLKFVKQMPQYKGEQHPERYEQEWQRTPGIVQNPKNMLSHDGYQYTW